MYSFFFFFFFSYFSVTFLTKRYRLYRSSAKWNEIKLTPQLLDSRKKKKSGRTSDANEWKVSGSTLPQRVPLRLRWRECIYRLNSIRVNWRVLTKAQLRPSQPTLPSITSTFSLKPRHPVANTVIAALQLHLQFANVGYSPRISRSPLDVLEYE